MKRSLLKIILIVAALAGATLGSAAPASACEKECAGCVTAICIDPGRPTELV